MAGSVAAGMLAGGLLTLRPDHYRVISTVRRAIWKRRWAEGIHPMTQAQIDQALGLRRRSDQVVRSI